MYLINLLTIFCLITTIYCLPIVETISNVELDNELKNPVSVDQALNKLNKAQLEDTTPSNLFNNNEPEEDKMFKINDANELIDTSNLAPSSKQQSSSGGIANVQSLIDQTNTISTNLETMIKEMTTNKRHATAAMLRIMLQNVRRLNTSLVRLNNRVNSLPIIGNSPASATPTSSASSSSSSSVSSSVSNSVSNATINAAAQINTLISNIKNQLNNVTNEINNLMQRIRLSIPSSGSKPSTPSG